MIKHIITSDALIITTSDGIFQFGKNDPNYQRVLSLCLNPEATSKDLININRLNYEDDNISLSYNSKIEEYELFYNSKYYYIDKTFIDILFNLVNDDNIPFKIEYAVEFFIKLLNNPYIKFNTLFPELLKRGFLFLSNGDIIIEKEFECEDNRYYDRKRTFIESNLIKKTFVVINPQNINHDYSFFGYRVIGSYIRVSEKTKLLNNSWIKNENTLMSNWEKILNILISEEFKLTKYNHLAKMFNIDNEVVSAFGKKVNDDPAEIMYEIMRMI
jgi:hypothetical protein